MGQAENVDYVVAGKEQTEKAQEHIARQEVGDKVLGTIDSGLITAGGSTYTINKDEHQGRSGVGPHAPPLQIAGQT